MKARRRVVVVGAGLAGLRAAWQIARAGHEVTVLERRSTPGGRAGSSIDEASGEPVDTGQHAFMGCYRSTRAWLAALGTESALRFQRRLSVPSILPDGTTRTFRAALLPAPLHLAGGMMAMPGLSLRERLALLRIAPDAVFPPGRGMDRITVAEWEARRRVPPVARERVLDPLAIAAVNESPAVASALPFLVVLRAMARTGNPGSVLGFAAGGLADLYVPAASRAIGAAGGNVRTGAWAVRLIAADGRAAGVELAEGETVPADCVVAAVPPWDLGALLGGHAALEPLALAAAAFRPSPIVTVHLWWDRPVLAVPFAGLPGGPFQWVFNRSVLVGPGRAGEQHLAFVRSGARELLGSKPGVLAGLAAGDLRKRLPAANAANVARARTVWETKATVSLVPGTDALRPGPVTALPGLVLAGDWTRTGLPATIEGAVASGEAAAHAMMKSFR